MDPNERYKRRYKKLKQRIKDLVIENAALCDEVSEMQETIAIAREERIFLLKRLIQHENPGDVIELVKNAENPNPLPPQKRGPKKKDRSLLNGSNSRPSTSSALSQATYEPQNKIALPINFGNFVLQSIGELMTDNVNFHNENWIYPVGYIATRVYAHPKNPRKKCVFTCKILNNSGVPQFQIIPDSEYDHVFFGESANICHIGLLEAIATSAELKNFPIRPQGEKFFGLCNATIMQMLQNKPNFKRLQNFKGFVVNMNDTDATLNFDSLQKLIYN
ncbi:TBRG1 family protein [Megaselia abdita]